MPTNELGVLLRAKIRIGQESNIWNLDVSRFAAFGGILGLGSWGACGRTGDTIVTPPSLGAAIVAGDRQSANIGHTLSTPLRIAVTTSDGRAVANVTVDWAVTTGGGKLLNSSVRTDIAALASVTWTLRYAADKEAVAAKASARPGSRAVPATGFPGGAAPVTPDPPSPRCEAD